MQILTIEPLDIIEFVDRSGFVRSIRGTSLLGLEEFKARIAQVGKILQEEPDESKTLADLYRDNTMFRHHCDRVLELNGIDPDWLDSKGMLLEALVLSYEGGVGLLVRLNTPPVSKKAQAGTGKPASIYDLGATLLALTGDLQKAITQLETLPAKTAIQILEARSDQLKTDEQRRKDWASQARSKPKPFMRKHGTNPGA